jgi:hypothetical protein
MNSNHQTHVPFQGRRTVFYQAQLQRLAGISFLIESSFNITRVDQLTEALRKSHHGAFDKEASDENNHSITDEQLCVCHVNVWSPTETQLQCLKVFGHQQLSIKQSTAVLQGAYGSASDCTNPRPPWQWPAATPMCTRPASAPSSGAL